MGIEIDYHAPQKEEIQQRIENLFHLLNSTQKEWDAVFLMSKVNHYYFTGTMQNGIFALKKDGSYGYFVRKSFERAKHECLINNIFPIISYKDISAVLGDGIKNIFIETEIATLGMMERLKKYFPIENVHTVDAVVCSLRAVKSEYELALIKESGRQHKYLFETIVPTLLKEGVTEAGFTASLIKEMIDLGYQGRSLFSMFQADIVAGQIAFGENSLYPTSFDGPGGMKGMHPAAPVVGDRSRTLKKGDLVFIDTGYGVNGYHTDRTQVYIFGANPTADMVNIHRKCLAIEKETAAMLKPGNIPSEIYDTVIGNLDNEFMHNFMGCGNEKVKFLGHGVGLLIDEYPVISRGFREPLKENMVIAIEPKRAVDGAGLVGVEDTYIVKKEGGVCVTGGEKDIIVV